MLLSIRSVLLAGFGVLWAVAQEPSKDKAGASQNPVINREALRARFKSLMPDTGKPEPPRKLGGAPSMKDRSTSDAAEDPMMPAAPTPAPDSFDAMTRQKYYTALQAYYDYRYHGYAIREQAFGWQSLSSKIIFFSVLFLVLAGIYFAAVQFHRSLFLKGTPAVPATSEVTEFDASFKGIKVSSPVLGVVILTISLAFFYLYLQFVYPIQTTY